VGERLITAGELRRFEAGLPAHLKSSGSQGRREHFQSLVDRRLLALEAREQGLAEIPQVQENLAEALNKRLIEQVVEEEIERKQEEPTEEEMQEAYERYDLGWQVWPAHILSATEAQAREVIRALEAGADFAVLARQRSLADDAERGGDLGKFFGPEDAVPTLREGTFHLEAGAISEPIQTKDGYEVVKILDKRRLPYEQLRPAIAKEMHKRKWAQRRAQVVEELKQRFQARFHGEGAGGVLRAAQGGSLSPQEKEAPLISYRGGALRVGTCAANLSRWNKGPLPADSLSLLAALEMWVLPDTLMALAAREEGRDRAPQILAWKEEKQEELMVEQLYAQEVAAGVSVGPEEIEQYYREHLGEFMVLPGVIHMSEVLVDTEAEAQRLLKAARDGARLEVLAAKHSRRPAMKPVGGHAYADSGRLVIASLYVSPYRDFFGDANQKDVGALQGPLPVQEKYSVFRLDRPIEPAPLSLEQVRRPIRFRLRKEREARRFEQFMDSLRAQRAGQVEWFGDNLARLEAPGEGKK